MAKQKPLENDLQVKRNLLNANYKAKLKALSAKRQAIYRDYLAKWKALEGGDHG